MFAVIVRVALDPAADQEQMIAGVQGRVIPAVKQAPGAISGHWLGPAGAGGADGVSFILFETREQAEAVVPSVPEHPAPGVTRVAVEVREVVAGF